VAENKKVPDWERIEVDYRAGLLSVREIAANHGITEGAIRKRAKRDDWIRDLKAKIKAKADDLVRKTEVRTEVRTEKAATERQLVDANAQVIADVRLRQRGDIAKAKNLAMRLLAELEAQTEHTDLVAQLTEVLASSGETSGGLMRMFERVTSTAGRVDTMKKLADSLKTLIGMEREAYEGVSDSGDQQLTQEAFDYSRLSKEALLELLIVAHEPAKAS
jgi:hypothetical protein